MAKYIYFDLDLSCFWKRIPLGRWTLQWMFIKSVGSFL